MLRNPAFRVWLPVCLAALLVLGACSDATPTPLPPVTAPAGAAPGTAVPATASPITVVAPASMSGVTAPARVTTVVTATAPATVTTTGSRALPTLTLSETLNVRSGPGIEYPVIVALPAGATAAVNGRSSDSGWWRIECPPQVASGQCWLISDPRYSALTVGGSEAAGTAAGTVALAAIAVATTGPPPAPTPAPSPTRCVAAHPDNWSSYRVRSGDTLSALAAASGAGVGAIQAANCLDSDLIIEGDVLYLPRALAARPATAAAAGAAVEPASVPVAIPPDSTSSATAGAPPAPRGGNLATLDLASAQQELNQQLAKSLSFSNPGSDPTCAPAIDQAEPSITIGTSESEQTHGTSWQRGELFGICWNSSGGGQAVTFIVSSPSGVIGRFRAEPDLALTWTVDAYDRLGLYTVTTKEAPDEQASFTVADGAPPAPAIVIFNRHSGSPVFSRGQDVNFVLSGYPAGPVSLAVCRFGGTPTAVATCFSLHDVTVGASGVRRMAFPTHGLPPGNYVLHDGADPHLRINLNDLRIFELR